MRVFDDFTFVRHFFGYKFTLLKIFVVYAARVQLNILIQIDAMNVLLIVSFK